MRVLHLAPTVFRPDGHVAGGAERYALGLATAMSTRVPTRLVTFGPQDDKRRVGNLELVVIGGDWHTRGRSHDPLSTRILPHLLWADVVHMHQREIRLSKVAACIGRGLRKRVVVTDHGGGAWGIAQYLRSPRLFSAHLHVSEFSKTVSGHGSLARAQTIYGGVDTDHFSLDRTAAVAPDLVTFVGRLLPHKGLEDLIDALPPAMRLDIVGRAHEPAYQESLGQRAGNRSIRFHTDFDDRQVANAYRSSLCVAVPSVYRARDGSETRVPELLGQTALEAMACGRPVVATDVGALPEVVAHETTGLVVPPNDPVALRSAIEKLQDLDLAARLGVAGRVRVDERFTWDRVVDKCLRAYG